jgi:hypothetical protein
MGFLSKSEAILKKLDSRQKSKPPEAEKPKSSIPVAATVDDEIQVVEVKKVEQKRCVQVYMPKETNLNPRAVSGFQLNVLGVPAQRASQLKFQRPR